MAGLGPEFASADKLPGGEEIGGALKQPVLVGWPWGGSWRHPLEDAHAPAGGCIRLSQQRFYLEAPLAPAKLLWGDPE